MEGCQDRYLNIGNLITIIGWVIAGWVSYILFRLQKKYENKKKILIDIDNIQDTSYRLIILLEEAESKRNKKTALINKHIINDIHKFSLEYQNRAEKNIIEIRRHIMSRNSKYVQFLLNIIFIKYNSLVEILIKNLDGDSLPGGLSNILGKCKEIHKDMSLYIDGLKYHLETPLLVRIIIKISPKWLNELRELNPNKTRTITTRTADNGILKYKLVHNRKKSKANPKILP